MAADFVGLISQKILLGTYDFPSTALTVTAWVLSRNLAGVHSILVKSNGSGLANQWVSMESNNTSFRIRLKVSGTSVTTSGNPLTLGTWEHVAATFDGATTRIFQNGVQTASNAQTGTVSQDATVNTRIGIGGSDANAWDGRIADVRVYNRALGDAEIASIHAARGDDKNIFGLVAKWPLKDLALGTTIATAAEISGNGPTGVGAGTPTYEDDIIVTRSKHKQPVAANL